MTEQQVRIALEQAFDGLIRVDDAGEVQWVNEGAARLLPLARGTTLTACLPTWAPEAGQRLCEGLLTVTIEEADGCWVGLRQDGQQALLSQALREAESRFEALLEAVSDGVVLRDRGGIVTHCNRKARELLYGGQDPRGTHFSDGLRVFSEKGEELAVADWPTSRALRTGQESREEVVRVVSDGREAWRQVNAAPLFFSDCGGPQGSVLALQDLTHRRAQDAALGFRDAILHSLSRCAALLLGSAELESAFTTSLEYLGNAAQAQRIYVYRAQQREGALVGDMLFEWSSPGVNPHLGLAELHPFDPSAWGLGHWLEELAAGRPVQCRLSTCKESERDFLERYRLKAICVVPMMLDSQQPWGVLGLDAVHTERCWSEAELEALGAAARLMRTALERQEAEQARAQSETRKR